MSVSAANKAFNPALAHFGARRLHSISGAIPLGLFLFSHLWTNLSAVFGRAAFDQKVAEIHALPALGWIEVIAIFLPLAFHAAYGIWLSREARYNVASYTHGRNWAYTFQRITGFVVFAFVLAHLWEYRVQVLLFGMPAQSFYDTMRAHFSWTYGHIPWIAVGYLIGSAAAVFHFANGLNGFVLSFGLVASRLAQRRLGALFTLVGLILFAFSVVTIVSLSTGSPWEQRTEAPDCSPSTPGKSAPSTK
jgi:succinate dehydrogenase / fumarate reductase, cytochrome b subunit